ncbi:MAG TPA: GNAT family N-acetyltransferase [Longimicrobium sp.]|nr:GNAT family N-acetyltransferase [Longimicrobium sp.]
MRDLIPEILVPRPVAELTAAEVVDALNRAFEGYLVPVRFTPENYERRLRGEHLDPFASRVYLYEGEPAGVILVARRGWTSRVAAMAVVPAARGQGVGRWMLAEAIGEARARGDRAMLLEVFEPNTRAVGLYKALGFRVLHRLVGYRLPPAPTPSEGADALEEVDPAELARFVLREGEPGLPWMLAGETMVGASFPARAYRLGGHAYALVADTDAEVISIVSLAVARAERRRGWGRRMVRALGAAFPGRALVVRQLVPEPLAPGFFAALGWEPLPLAQLEIRLDLGA